MNTAQDPAPALLATALEEAGFESLWFGEHSHIPVSRQTPYRRVENCPHPIAK
jgi:alkanesulfonate monooxygenase SsuD/methylene tetrahydromethanopterin reductase-like flavin-dependent oxidoreductase (luciferase family)